MIGMNPNLYVFAHFFKYDRQALAARLFNILLLALLSCVPVLVTYFLISGWLDGHHITLGIFLVLMVIALGRAVAAMHLAVEQMQRKPILYFVFYLIMATSVVTVVAVLIVADRFTWQSLLLAEAVVLLLLNLVYLGRLYRRGYLSAEPDIAASREFTVFSAPLLGHAAALWAISFIDRLIIAEIVGIEAVGAYSVAHTVALGLSLVHESIHRAWQPIFYQKMQSGKLEDQKSIVRYTWVYYGVVAVTAALYLLLMKVVLSLFLPPEYGGVFTFLPYLIAGVAWLGMYRFSAGYFYHYGNTKMLSVLTVCCGLFHVGITILLVSGLGAVGAAYAAAVSYFLLWAGVTALVTRVYKVRWIGRTLWR
jgi:O-antigen/teichoic acid export membrane protein